MIDVIINNQKIQAEDGATVLDVANQNGIDIPTFCHHPALESQGACRICTVKVSQGKWEKFVTACNYPVWDGIEIHTHSEDVINARKIVIELLLARCPNVEIVQNIAKELGVEKPRFQLEDDNCILCGLCVRVCEERMGRSAISLIERGTELKVGTPFNRKSDVCMACGACATICPTEAIKIEYFTDLVPEQIPSEFDEGLRPRKPIYLPYPQAIPNTPAIDKETCIHFKTGKCKILDVEFSTIRKLPDIELPS